MDNMEQLLRRAAPKPTIRPDLAARTLMLAIQARRARTIRRWVLGLLVLSLVVLVAKWLKNDAAFLVSLLIQRPDVVRAQADLFRQAALESVPWAQVTMLVGFAILWLGWRRFETFLLAGRKTSTNEGIVMKTIKLTPRFAAATLILGATTLGISGYTYAQVQEQHKLDILRQAVNASGRSELEVNAEACAPNPWVKETTTFEVIKGSQISDEDARSLVKAACYESTARNILRTQLGSDNFVPPHPAAQIAGFKNQTLSLISIQDGNQSTEEQKVSADLKVYDLSQGRMADASALKSGALIVPYAVSPAGSTPTNWQLETKAVVILPADPGLQWYDWSKQLMLSRLAECEGNPKDRCHFGPDINVFRGPIAATGEYAKDAYIKTIGGVITQLAANQATIKTSSGRTISIKLGYNGFGDYNSHPTEGLRVEVGDTLRVDYSEPARAYSNSIQPDQIASVGLVLERRDATGTTKY